MNKILQRYLSTYFKGMGMGAADVVPGVSGGTIAFITGIYEELINSIKSINFQAVKLFFTFKWKQLFYQCNLGFLFALLFGILTSVFSLAKVVQYFLENEPIIIWSFFFGLVLASTVIVLRKVKPIGIIEVLFFLIGGGIAYYVTVATPSQTPDDMWFIFLSGAIAICAMILPGISGSFILVLLCKYEYILGAVTNGNFLVLGVFACGALIGILSFSHFLSWLLKNYHNITISLLAGFMLGSLNKVWPWKRVLSDNPLKEESILPSTYSTQIGDPQLLTAICMCLLGIVIILFVEYLNSLKRKADA